MSTNPVLGSSFVTAGSSPPYESDVEAELEVDQLDSDSEVDQLGGDQAKPSTTSKNGGPRPGERVPGHTLLPASRMENMIQADGGTGSMALSKEAMFVLSVAAEDFIKSFIQAGHREATAHRRNQVNYLDMAATTQQYQEFMFLSDAIPVPIPLMEALMLRRDKEREEFEVNPALAALTAPPSTWMPPPPVPQSRGRVHHGSPPPNKRKSSSKSKSASTSTSAIPSEQIYAYNRDIPSPHQNFGPDIPSPPLPPTLQDYKRRKKIEMAAQAAAAGSNGHHHTSSSGHHHHPPHDLMDVSESSDLRRRSPHGTTSTSSSGQPSHYVNGTQTPPFEEPMDATSHHPPADYPGAHSPPYQGEEEPAWSGSTTPQHTGTGSGSAPHRGGDIIPFSRSTQNPGRTIYSQTNT